MKSVIFISILVMLIVGLGFELSFALSGSSTEYGSLNIDKDSFSITESEITIISISGTTINYKSGQNILIEIIKPDNSSIEIKTKADNAGSFSTPIILDSNWEEGHYKLIATYLNDEIGSASFVITSVYTSSVPTFSNIGSLEIDSKEITITGNEKSTIEVEGNIEDYERGKPISLKIIHPDGLITNLIIKGQSNGDFTAHIKIEDDWKSGIFTISASYDEKDFGKVDFQLNKIQIPLFFKNVASWWSDGMIEDTEFVSGVEYLINEDIIQIPNLSKNASNDENIVPDWVRQNIGWWSNGITSDVELVNSIQYLVEKGIIQVN